MGGVEVTHNFNLLNSPQLSAQDGQPWVVEHLLADHSRLLTVANRPTYTDIQGDPWLPTTFAVATARKIAIQIHVAAEELFATFRRPRHSEMVSANEDTAEFSEDIYSFLCRFF